MLFGENFQETKIRRKMGNKLLQRDSMNYKCDSEKIATFYIAIL